MNASLSAFCMRADEGDSYKTWSLQAHTHLYTLHSTTLLSVTSLLYVPFQYLLLCQIFETMSGALAGRVAVVTGSSSGIGQAIALAFHREGCKVVCADLRPQGEGRSTDETITKDGGDALFCKTDVSQATDVEAAVKAAVNRYGRLDM